MTKIDITSRLKGQLAKAELVKSVLGTDFIRLAPEHFDFSYFNEMECDSNLKNFLREKTLQMINLQGNTSLTLGKICGEVAEELGKKGSPEGIYYKWLEFNGLSKNTALRHRKRYELFTMARETKLKEIMVLLTIKEIETIYNEKENLMVILNEEKNPELKTIKSLVSATLPDTPPRFLGEDHISDFEKSLERFGKIMSNLKKSELPPKKQEKLESLMEQIEKLLG